MAMLILIVVIIIMLLLLLLALVKLLLRSKHLVKSFTFITPMFAVVFALLLFPIYIKGTRSRGANQLAQGHTEIWETRFV